MKRIKISVIVACFNEEKNIQKLYERVKRVFEKIKYDYELIYVDNDSEDKSLLEYKDLIKKDKRVKTLLMSRNFGSPQSSFLAGMKNMSGDAAVIISGDIQDPPELIPEFIKKWEKGYKVVYGISYKRDGIGWFYKFFYKTFYIILNKLSYIKMPLNASDFSLIDKQVVEELLEFGEFEYYLRCLRAYVGYDQTGIKYRREPRKYGKSATSLSRSFYFAKAIIINFSFRPLTFISQLAFITVLATIFLIVVNLIMYFMFQDAPRGIPTIVLLILFFSAIQLLSLSVIGEYLARIYMEVKNRPRYIVKKGLNVRKIIQDK